RAARCAPEDWRSGSGAPPCAAMLHDAKLMRGPGSPRSLTGRVRPLLLPTLSGVLYFLSWIGFGIWPLAFVCFLPLLWSLRDVSLKQAFLRGWWMGFVTHLGGYPWLIHLLSVFAGAPWPLAFVGYLLVCAAQGLVFA